MLALLILTIPLTTTLPSPLLIAVGSRFAPVVPSSYTFGVTCHPVGYARPLMVSAGFHDETYHEITIYDGKIEVTTRSCNHVDHSISATDFVRGEGTTVFELRSARLL